MSRPDFRRLEKIGEGQYGHIFLAESAKYPQGVVLKQIDKRHGCRQHELLPSLKHPNIIKVFQTFLEEDSSVIVMQYAVNGDLSSYVKKQYPHDHIPQKIVRSWFVQLCLALYYLHYEQNIIHRDLKLINVLVMKDKTIKIADFGLAKRVHSKDEKDKNTVGTPYYLSPESISQGSFTIKSDVWGLGCLLYELCTGNKPFKGKAFGEIFQNIVQGFVEQFPPEAQYSKWLQTTVCSLLQKNSQKRPSILSLLQDPEMRKEFQLLKLSSKDYSNLFYPEISLKTTKYYESQQKYNCFKNFSESLKTSKKDKIVRIQFSEEKGQGQSTNIKKVQREKFETKSLHYFLKNRL